MAYYPTSRIAYTHQNPAQFMKRIFHFFQRLQWQLTLSYVIVTMATVIVLGLLIVGVTIVAENQSSVQTNNSIMWTRMAFESNIAQLLTDPIGLQAWLTRVQRQGFKGDDLPYFPEGAVDYANTLVTESAPIYVIDAADFRVVGAAPADTVTIGASARAVNLPGVSLEVLWRTINTGTESIIGSTTPGESVYTVTAPIYVGDSSEVVAVAVYSVDPLAFALPADFSFYIEYLLLLAVIILLATLPIGAIFGWFASRGLRRRLSALSLAAGAWSRGDFSMVPQDRSVDEIGELTRNLGHMADQLQSYLVTRDELARMEERNRLARDLHDTVKQQTYAARMQLSAARNLLASDPGAAAEHVEAALQLNRETQQELKLIIDELRPPVLEGKGLPHALKEYTTRWQEHTGIRVDVVAGGEQTLPLAVEQTLYRILQESLSNVARHAEADAVHLSLTMTPQRVVLLITDNGRGFDPSAVSQRSFGLAGMRQRLAEVNGALNVESLPGNGTTVIAQISFK